MSEELKGKKLKFAQSYLLTFNATQSAIEAGYAEDSARQQGSRLLTNDDIVAFLDKEREKGAEAFKITREAMTQRYLDLAEMHQEVTPAVTKGCYDSLTKMHGINEPEKIDLTTKGDNIRSMDYSNFSESTLAEIAGAGNKEEENAED